MSYKNPYEEPVESQASSTEKARVDHRSQEPRLNFNRNRLEKRSRWKLGLGLILLGLIGLNCFSALAALRMQVFSGIVIAAAMVSIVSGLTLCLLSFRTRRFRYQRNR